MELPPLLSVFFPRALDVKSALALRPASTHTPPERVIPPGPYSQQRPGINNTAARANEANRPSQRVAFGTRPARREAKLPQGRKARRQDAAWLGLRPVFSWHATRTIRPTQRGWPRIRNPRQLGAAARACCQPALANTRTLLPATSNIPHHHPTTRPLRGRSHTTLKMAWNLGRAVGRTRHRSRTSQTSPERTDPDRLITHKHPITHENFHASSTKGLARSHYTTRGAEARGKQPKARRQPEGRKGNLMPTPSATRRTRPNRRAEGPHWKGPVKGSHPHTLLTGSSVHPPRQHPHLGTPPPCTDHQNPTVSTANPPRPTNNQPPPNHRGCDSLQRRGNPFWRKN